MRPASHGSRRARCAPHHEDHLDRDGVSSNRHPALSCLSMIFSENRYPPIGSWPEGMLFRIMLYFYCVTNFGVDFFALVLRSKGISVIFWRERRSGVVGLSQSSSERVVGFAAAEPLGR